MCRLITWSVHIWNHDLVEVRHTHVRANKEHCTSIAVVSFTIGTIHTCNIFDITIIVVMSEMHVRIMCRCITWNVVVSQLSLVEARVTHVRANNEHSTRP